MSKRSTTKDKPGVLVVIATLGQRPDYLKLTLESIKKQGYSPLDVVLVYPFKSKETKAIAEAYGARSLDDPGSMSAAVNLGINSADKHHTYVTWIGDDDLLEADMIKSSVALLEKKPTATASFGHCHYIDEDGKRLFTSKAGTVAPWLMTWGPNLVPLPGSMFRLSSLKKLDYIFDDTLRYAMDLDLFLRLRKLGPLVNVRMPVSSFRWHTTSTTVANRQASLKEAEEVKRRHLNGKIKFAAPLWEKPVRIATTIAAKRVSKSKK